MLAYILNIEGSSYRQSNVFRFDQKTKLLVPVGSDRIERLGFQPYPFRSHDDLVQVWAYEKIPTRVVIGDEPADNLAIKLRAMPDGANGIVVDQFDPQKDYSSVSRSRGGMTDAARVMQGTKRLGGQVVMAAYFRFSPRLLRESEQLETALFEQEPGFPRP